MNDTLISFDDERLIRDGEDAVVEYSKNANRMRMHIMTMARGLMAARRRYPADLDFGRWLKQSVYSEIGKSDRAALIKIGEHERFFTKIISSTTLLSPRTIWEEYSDVVEELTVSHDGKPTAELTPTPEPEVLPVVEPQTEETVHDEETISTAPTIFHDVPKSSRLHNLLGDDVANVLLQRFPKLNAQVFAKQISKKNKDDKGKLRYLAKRCVMPDYPVALLQTESWTWQLLYPRLPKKLLDMLRVPTLIALHKYHTALVETERRFMLTPECGVTDPPLVAFNRAHDIYHAVINARKGVTVDKAWVNRGPVYNTDEGKPPVIIRGKQLWPAEVGAGYGYDDLRCAYGIAYHSLLPFAGARDLPIASQSQRLRELMAWFPGGINSIGAELDGTFKALKAIVNAYNRNESDLMRPPPSMTTKRDEV